MRSDAPGLAVREGVERTLRALVGQPFLGMGRAAAMAWLGFGDRVEVRRRKGGTKLVPRHALHLQCVFRLSGPAGIVTTAHDMRYGAENPGHEPDDFVWDSPGANWYDRRVAQFLEQNATAPPLVEHVEADELGGFRLSLSAGYRLEVLPGTSFPREHWRYFRTDLDEAHFVVFEDGDDDE